MKKSMEKYPFKIGDKVVCVDSSGWPLQLFYGKIYTVTDVLPEPDPDLNHRVEVDHHCELYATYRFKLHKRKYHTPTDKERLDWVSKSSYGATLFGGEWEVAPVDSGANVWVGKTLRQAIDAAMRNEKKTK